MKQTRDDIRKKIFNSFSINLDLINQRFDLQLAYTTESGLKNNINNNYICPLCFKVFLKEDLNQKLSNPLTIEDLPPKSIKKEILILTCKKCNNEAGYKLDYIIQQHLQTEPFLRGEVNSTISANLNLENNKYIKGQFKILEDKSLLFDLQNKSNQFFDDSFKSFIENWSKKEYKMQFQAPERRKVALAFLRIGYLIFFNYFGYLALFDDNLKKIRDQLQQPNKQVLSKIGIIYNLEKKNVPKGVYIIRQPLEMKSYLVVIDISTNTLKKKIGIVIPGPGKIGYKNYQKVITIKSSDKIELFNVASKEYLTNIELVNAYYYLFANIN